MARAITNEVAATATDLQQHLMALAQEDKKTLRAELDQLHGTQRAG